MDQLCVITMSCDIKILMSAFINITTMKIFFRFAISFKSCNGWPIENDSYYMSHIPWCESLEMTYGVKYGISQPCKAFAFKITNSILTKSIILNRVILYDSLISYKLYESYIIWIIWYDSYWIVRNLAGWFSFAFIDISAGTIVLNGIPFWTFAAVFAILIFAKRST